MNKEICMYILCTRFSANTRPHTVPNKRIPEHVHLFAHSRMTTCNRLNAFARSLTHTRHGTTRVYHLSYTFSALLFVFVCSNPCTASLSSDRHHQQHMEWFCGEPHCLNVDPSSVVYNYFRFHLRRAVTDPRDGRRVALKKLPNVFQSLVSSKRVFRELKMLCYFKHENVSGRQVCYAHNCCAYYFAQIDSHPLT